MFEHGAGTVVTLAPWPFSNLFGNPFCLSIWQSHLVSELLAEVPVSQYQGTSARAKVKNVWSYTHTPPYAIIGTGTYLIGSLCTILAIAKQCGRHPKHHSVSSCEVRAMASALYLSYDSDFTFLVKVARTHLLINLNDMSPLCSQWMRLVSDLDHIEIILLESHSQGNLSHGMFKMYCS